MKLYFLIYDSRSGSTLLSREIDSYCEDAVVTPELRFDGLLRRGEKWLESVDDRQLQSEMEKMRIAEKLDWSPERLGRVIALRNAETGFYGLMEAIVRELAGDRRKDSVSVAVIKSGVHIRVWQKIHRYLPAAGFIYAVRDPRAVVASKLLTKRPYVPDQTMAWAGVFAMAAQWRMYCAAAGRMQRKGVRVCTVRYDDLVAKHSETMESLSRFLGARHGATRGQYQVPKAERDIHRLVESDGVSANRLQAWRETLSTHDQSLVETICSEPMRKFGYQPDCEHGVIRSAVLLLRGGIDSLVRVSREMIRRVRAARRQHAATR